MLRTLLSIILAFIIAGFVVDQLITNWLQEQFDKNLLDKARVLVTLTKDQKDGIDFDFADEFMPEYESIENTEYFQIWIDGEGTFEKSNLLKTNLPIIPFTDFGHSFQTIHLEDGKIGRMVQIVFLPQIPEDEDRTPEKLANQKKITLVAAKNINELTSLINTVHYSIIVGLSILTFLVAIQIHLIIKNGISPLRKIQSQLKLLDTKKLNQRLNIKHSPTELSSIVTEFNNLFDKVEASLQREKQFSSDVAHELKTPVSELRMLAEVAQKWPENNNEEVINDVLDAAKQMQHIINRLFELARYEKGSITLNPTSCDLNKLIENTLDRSKNEINENNLIVIKNFSSDENVLSSSEEIELILSNLVLNAIKYAPKNDTLECNLFKDSKKGLIIEFINTAENLTQKDLPYLFDRMWQKTMSRSGSNAGLGLSLVKAYADLLSLQLETTLDKNKRFSIRLYGFKTKT